jgi:hypothetical protein
MTMRDVDVENDIHQWERKAVAGLLALLGTCFMIWAGVVWNSGQNVVGELRQARMEDAQYRLLMERRLTVAEQQLTILQQRQEWVISRLISPGHGEVPP